MIRLAVALAAASTLLAGCGIKGPLYLPERNTTVITRPAQTGAATGTARPQAAAPAAPAAPAPAPNQKHDGDPQPRQ
ncbi:MAG: lipoprotein [Proteobacteria bacterium]|nr:lipoprotein [Pseudomonadota bacterium]